MPSGKKTKIVYDVAWQKTSETLGYGTAEAATTSYSYDLAGNLAKITDALGHAAVTTFDSRNRPLSVADPLANKTQWTYDVVSNKLTETRPDNGITTMAYDAMHRLLSTTDPKNQATSFAYDASGNLVTLTDARNSVTRFTYDLRNQRTRKTYADNTHDDWAYDAVGNMVTTTKPAGQILTATYDVRNRPTLLDWSDATPDVSKTYDAASRVLRASSSVSLLSYTYDIANQLVSETQAIAAPVNLPAKTVGYTYDADGNRASLIYPDGTVIAYNYTGRNQVAGIAADGPPPLATYSYDLAGRRLSKALENGTSATYNYDNANRLLSINQQLVSGNVGIAYALNSVGDRTSRTETSGADIRTDAYGYDAIDQLTQVKYGFSAPANTQGRQVDYSYDPAGNRSSLTEDADGSGPGSSTSTAYSANALNQYTAISPVTAPVFDANGSMVSFQAQSGAAAWFYQYDAQSRLTGGYNGTDSFSFAYDARNRCVARTINGVTTLNIYDGWNLLEDRTAADSQFAKYYHGAATDEILATVTTGGVLFHHHDGLGNVIALTNSTGTAVERYRYDAYGTPAFFNATGTAIVGSQFSNRFLYTGREWFSKLSLQDNRNRYYQPTIGRWLSRDPIEESGGRNLYAYNLNSPINWIDPLGLRARCCEDELKQCLAQAPYGARE